MKQEFITSENEHWYQSPSSEGTWYPSVTTITSIFPKGKGFEMYLTKQESWESSQDILKEAGQRGTRVHEATELLEKGQTLKRDSYSLDEWQRIIGFVNWHKEYKPKVVAVEECLVSDISRVGGKVDRVYKIKKVLTLLDIKTSSKIFDSQWVQVGKYAHMWNEKYPKKGIAQTAILRLTADRKDGYEYKTHDIGEIIEDNFIFDGLKQLWHYMNPKKVGPKTLEVPEELKL